MSNILVTGAHGPLGNEMQRLAEQDAENMYVFQMWQSWILRIWTLSVGV